MIEVLIPSPQVNKEHLEYEKEMSYIERWQNELFRIVLKCNTPQDKENWKHFILENANDSGLHPLEELRRYLNNQFHKKNYERFRSITS